MNDEWRRVSKATPCTICEKPDWCTVAIDGDAACCMRIESSRQLSNGGWLHRLTSHTRDRRCVNRRPQPIQQPAPMRDFNKPAAQCEQRMSDALRSRFAEQLGVAVESLRRLYVGYDGQALTFPMRRPDGFICGIRRRFPDGRKLSVRGGREGLFIPMQLADTGPLVVTEGPTDTAALLSLGLAAIGRPSCTGGKAYVVQFARGRDVVIVGDQDVPGQRGAIALAQELRRVCPSVKIIIPPIGLKDARAWIQAGANRRDIESTIAAGVQCRDDK